MAPRRQEAPSYPEGVDELYAGLSETPLVVPVQLTQHLMRKSGQGPILYNMGDEREYNEDMRMAQVVSFAAQRFLATVLNDAMQHQKLRRTAGQKVMKEHGLDPKDKRRVLRTEDLSKALMDHGVMLRNPPYYVDAVKKDAAAAPAAGAGPAGQQQQPQAAPGAPAAPPTATTSG